MSRQLFKALFYTAIITVAVVVLNKTVDIWSSWEQLSFLGVLMAGSLIVISFVEKRYWRR